MARKTDKGFSISIRLGRMAMILDLMGEGYSAEEAFRILGIRQDVRRRTVDTTIDVLRGGPSADALREYSSSRRAERNRG